MVLMRVPVPIVNCSAGNNLWELQKFKRMREGRNKFKFIFHNGHLKLLNKHWDILRNMVLIRSDFQDSGVPDTDVSVLGTSAYSSAISIDMYLRPSILRFWRFIGLDFFRSKASCAFYWFLRVSPTIAAVCRLLLNVHRSRRGSFECATIAWAFLQFWCLRLAIAWMKRPVVFVEW